MSAEVAATSCLRRSCVDGSCRTVCNDMPKDTSKHLRSFLNKASRLLHHFFIVTRLGSTPNTGTCLSFHFDRSGDRHEARWKSSRQLVGQVEPRLTGRGVAVPPYRRSFA